MLLQRSFKAFISSLSEAADILSLPFRLQMKRMALCYTILMLFIWYSSVGSQTEDANSTCGRQRLRYAKSL